MANPVLAQALLGLLGAAQPLAAEPKARSRSRSSRERRRRRSRRSTSRSPDESRPVAVEEQLDSFALEKLEGVALHHRQHRNITLCRQDQVVTKNDGSRIKAMAIGNGNRHQSDNTQNDKSQ